LITVGALSWPAILNGFWNDRVALTDFHVAFLAGKTAVKLSKTVGPREGADDMVTRG